MVIVFGVFLDVLDWSGMITNVWLVSMRAILCTLSFVFRCLVCAYYLGRRPCEVFEVSEVLRS